MQLEETKVPTGRRPEGWGVGVGVGAVPVTGVSASRPQEELDSTDTSVVISSCSLAEARLLLDNFLKASIDKVGAGWLPGGGPGHSCLCD